MLRILNIFPFTFLLFFLPFYLHAQTNLEEFTQDFVLETKRIIIEGAPNAFNASIVRWRGLLLMSFRIINELSSSLGHSSAEESKIGLIWLDEEFNLVSEPQYLAFDHPNKKRPYVLAEDGRLIVKDDCLYIVYSGNKEQDHADSGFRMYIAQLEYDGEFFYIVNNECLSIFEDENQNKREKNWVPFVHEEELLLAYGLFPHKILKPLLDGSEYCKTFSESLPSIVWEWGEIRGGTPALPLNDQYYLGFFHSSIPLATMHSNNEVVLHYFIGAYLFSSKPPFEIKHISPEPVVGKNFYQGEAYQPYWHPVNVVFPCGLIIDEEYVWITYGRQDHEIWIAKLSKTQLLQSLINVSTILDKG